MKKLIFLLMLLVVTQTSLAVEYIITQGKPVGQYPTLGYVKLCIEGNVYIQVGIGRSRMMAAANKKCEDPVYSVCTNFGVFDGCDEWVTSKITPTYNNLHVPVLTKVKKP